MSVTGFVFFAITLFAYIGLASATPRIAHKQGRSDLVWLLYALLLPGISFVHSLLLKGGSDNLT